MIEKIKITNFKSIEELELDLGRVNVLIGENGCGKTNILEGIAMGAVGYDSEMHKAIFTSVGVREVEYNHFFGRKLNIETEYTAFNIIFELNGGSKYPVFIFYRSENELISLITDENLQEVKYSRTYLNLLNKVPNKKNLKTDTVETGTLFENFKAFLEEDNKINSIGEFCIYCPENTFLRHFEGEGKLDPLGIRGEGLFKELQKIIKHQPEKFKEIKEGLRAIDWFEDLELPEDLFIAEKRINLKDRYLNSNPDVQFLDQRSANEGFLFLLFYFTLFVSDDTPKFFAIDNIDQALNPRLCIKLMQTLTDMAKKHDKQVIFTTHNPSILDGLDLEDKEKDQRLFVVYRNADGNTVAKRHMRKEGIPGVEPARLSEAFIRGYLGGLPKNF